MRLARFIYVLAGLCLTGEASFAQASERNLTTMRDVSADLANSYLRIWSSNNGAALYDVHEVYASRVNFYGRLLDKRGIAAEKMRFVQRWPLRRYSLRPGTTRVDCDPNRRRCLVRALIDWETASPERRAVSRGISELKLGVGFSGPYPMVVYESGRVISRGPTL